MRALLLSNISPLLSELDVYLQSARRAVEERTGKTGTERYTGLERHQTAAHAFAWIAACVEAIRASALWYGNLCAQGKAAEIDDLLFGIGVGQYLSDLGGGIAMSATETIRPSMLGLTESATAFSSSPHVQPYVEAAESEEAKRHLVSLLRGRGDAAAIFGTLNQSSTLELVREQYRRVAIDHIKPFADIWHKEDALIPLELVEFLGDLGTFGLTVTAAHGGSEMGREAMCVVSEELSRESLAVGSLATRSEIACDLIGASATAEQQSRYLHKIATGQILTTAAFTEPNAGSDLASLQTRAIRKGTRYEISGSKTWITHGARADIMVLLARTASQLPGHEALTLFLVEKPRGTVENPFPAAGMSGTEIQVLGYRGMKEYEIAFDSFPVPGDCLLGGVEGQGFRQLMSTFETARIQTAARAIGVAQKALDLGLTYAETRVQFRRPIIDFPRIVTKIARMASELMMLRQQVYAVARLKETGGRCDVEAGMVKLLASRLAWIAADDSLQIHGGNGYAQEYSISRVLCDARILSIFEGAAEIQAQVVARGLLKRARAG